jgi:hypothetical protein
MPFLNPIDNYLQTASLGSIAFTYFVALVLKSGTVPASQGEPLVRFLIVTHAFVYFIIFLATLRWFINELRIRFGKVTTIGTHEWKAEK